MITCKQCKNAQRWACGSKFYCYCGGIKSNRTLNGLLKIKLKNTACFYFVSKSESEEKND